MLSKILNCKVVVSFVPITTGFKQKLEGYKPGWVKVSMAVQLAIVPQLWAPDLPANRQQIINT